MGRASVAPGAGGSGGGVGHWSHGGRPILGAVTRITIGDVAAAAGVSKTAVSFAFNSPDRLGQETLERVLRVADELGYAPFPAARALSLKRSGSIGLLIPQRLSTLFANPFVGQLIQGLGEFAEEHDLRLVLVPPLDGSLEGAIRGASVDGFISLGLSPGDPGLAMLDRLGIPTVLIDSDASADHPTVNVDDAGGAEAAACHLIELGHREIGIMLLPPTRSGAGPTPVVTRRLAGYRRAFETAGLPEPVAVVGGITMADAARAYRELAEGSRRPTGILAMSDMAAIGLMAAAHEAGLRLPRDLSVVGYDDLPMAALTTPALTTVRQPTVEKGRLAGRLLIRRLQGRHVDSPSPLATSLVVRASTLRLEEVERERG
jgi:DNA-binding LacI/PurR family transcriptional regulator